MIKFGYTIAYVDDVRQALEFFEKVFDFKTRFMTDEGDYGELDTGAAILAFADHSLGETNFAGGYVKSSQSQKPLGMEIALVTDDLRSFHSRALNHGAKELQAPITKPWGQMVSYFQSPSGILIELCTPMGGA